jgi:ketosteroid isomerase-like protein
MKRVALGLGAAALGAAYVLLRRRHHGGSEEVVRAYFDAWSDGDGEAIRDLVSDDYHAHVQTLGGMEERGADELISVVDSHAKAFSKVDYELHDLLCHNGCVAVRATMHARHEETGREGEIDGIAILRVDGGRVAEEWSSWDYLSLVDQLGLAEGG